MRPGGCWSGISVLVWRLELRLIIITVLLVVSKKQEIFIFFVFVCVRVRLETFVSFHSIVPLIVSRIRKQ